MNEGGLVVNGIRKARLGAMQNFRVLVVDDGSDSLRPIRTQLTNLGCKVDWSINVSDAVRLFSPDVHRILIASWNFPGTTGIRLCQSVREKARRYTYCFLVVPELLSSIKAEAYDMGIDGLLVNPFRREDLRAELAAALRILQMEDDLVRKNEGLENKLRQQEHSSRRVGDLFVGLPVAAFTLASDGEVQEWNRMAEKLFRISAPEACFNQVGNLFPGADPNIWEQRAFESTFAGMHLEGIEWTLETGGKALELVTDLLPIWDNKGGVNGAVAVTLDMTERNEQARTIEAFANEQERQRLELEDANRRLAELALTDGLTGLANHRHFQEALERICLNADRTGEPVSVMMIDVDLFKNFNDEFGHVAGDEVLKAVATTIKGATRGSDLPARYGGEEFSVVLPSTGRTEALRVAGRVRQRLAEIPWVSKPVTVSIGVSTNYGPNLKPRVCIEQADAALYESKGSGRNKVRHFGKTASTTQRKTTAA